MSLELSAIQPPPPVQETQLSFRERCQIAQCRSCYKDGLHPVLDLGEMPLADKLITRPGEPEPVFPLELGFCRACALVQIIETVPPEQLFGSDYPYYSSFSDHLLRHSARNAEALIASRRLGKDSLVVELASNDGYMLRNFLASGIPVLGIDPAPGPAAAAERIGIRTLREFFTRDLAERLAADGQRADLVIANNVLAHVADTNGFVAGIARLLKPTGVAVLEVPYVRDLIDHGEFDTIYHEHLCYFSVTSARALFKRHGLYLNRVERIAIHGGSLRLFVEPRERVETSVRELAAEEAREGLTFPSYYTSFGARVRATLKELRTLIRAIKSDGDRIAAYGAAAKGAILLNALGAGDETIDFVVDRNPHKQGKYMPGVHIPILPPEELLARAPEFTILLPWNFKDEILAQQAEYRRRGGKFIIPIPSPRVV